MITTGALLPIYIEGEAHKQERLKHYLNRAVIGPRLLIIDEIGYLPFDWVSFKPALTLKLKGVTLNDLFLLCGLVPRRAELQLKL